MSLSREDVRLMPDGELIKRLMTYEMQDDADDDEMKDGMKMTSVRTMMAIRTYKLASTTEVQMM